MAVDGGLTDQVHHRLRSEILEQVLPAGTRLSVPATAERFGVSRSPAREAISRLVMEGLAEFAPHKGAVVAQVDQGTLGDIYRVREVLEGLACSLAATRASADDLDALAVLVAEHQAAVDDEDVERHYALDQAFHEKVRAIAGNPPLDEQLVHFQRQIRLAMGTTRHSAGGPPLAVREHRRIVEAIASGDVQLAEAAGRAHIRRLFSELG